MKIQTIILSLLVAFVTFTLSNYLYKEEVKEMELINTKLEVEVRQLEKDLEACKHNYNAVANLYFDDEFEPK